MQRDLLSSSCVQHQPAGVYAAGSSKVTQGDTAYMIRPVHCISAPQASQRMIG